MHRSFPPQDIHGAPDYAQHGWQHGDMRVLFPGSISAVTVALTRERNGEQANVTLHSTAGLRVRAQHYCPHWADEYDDEPERITTEHMDADGVDVLQLSSYGSAGAGELSAALRAAADLLDADASGHESQ